MKPDQTELDPRLQRLLDLLRPVPPLDAGSSALARADFLAQVDVYRQTVSTGKGWRHKEWIAKINPLFHRKELHPMLSILMTIALGIAVLFGGAGSAVFAAQDSLPGETMYAVKTWSEDFRLQFTSASQAQIDLALEYANRRMVEIKAMHAAGLQVPPETGQRFQEELELALQLGAGLDNPQMVQAMSRIRVQAEAHLQTLQGLIQNSAGGIDPVIAQIQVQLREQARLAGLGQTNPDAVRDQIRARDRDRLNIRLHTPQPTAAAAAQGTPTAAQVGERQSYGPGPLNASPAAAAGSYGPGPQSTPGTGSRSTPGAGDCTATCTPALDGTGPGPGPNPAPGQNPTAGAGAGTGPGSQAGSATCTPVLDGSGPGPGPGPAPVNPSATPEPPGGPGSGGGQATPSLSGPGNPGGSPTQDPGNGNGKP